MFALKSWGTGLAARSIWVGLTLIVSIVAGSPLALAQSAYYNPQQSSGDGRYPVPHTGILNGKFWTDFRYRYEFVDQANLPKDARASTLKNKTGVESGFFHGFRAGVEGEFVVDVGPEDFNNTINGKTQFPIVADVQSAEVDQAYLESHNIPGVALLAAATWRTSTTSAMSAPSPGARTTRRSTAGRRRLRLCPA